MKKNEPRYGLTPPTVVDCDRVLSSITGQVSIAQIVARHGVRTPGPATAKRDFSICFVAASHERLLNATEMTFYETLAEWFTRTMPPEAPNPGLGEGWTPITSYFGEGTTWSSKGLGLIRPTITNVQWTATGFRIDGVGYPGRSYRLLGTTKLTAWTNITNQIAGTRGSLSLLDTSKPRPTMRLYKVVTP